MCSQIGLGLGHDMNSAGMGGFILGVSHHLICFTVSRSVLMYSIVQIHSRPLSTGIWQTLGSNWIQRQPHPLHTPASCDPERDATLMCFLSQSKLTSSELRKIQEVSWQVTVSLKMLQLIAKGSCEAASCYNSMGLGGLNIPPILFILCKKASWSSCSFLYSTGGET